MKNPFFEHPILNSPYECPARHWELDAEGELFYPGGDIPATSFAGDNELFPVLHYESHGRISTGEGGARACMSERTRRAGRGPETGAYGVVMHIPVWDKPSRLSE